jgi:hypothetical protein
MSRLSTRLARLEQHRGPQKIVIVNVTHDDNGCELAPEEVENRIAAAREEVGTDGLVIRWGYYEGVH